MIKNKVLVIDSYDKIYTLVDIAKEVTKNDNYLVLCEAILGFCGALFITDRINDIFERYYWEKKFNVSSFGGIDETPEWWKRIVYIIDSEMSKVREESVRDNKNKNSS